MDLAAAGDEALAQPTRARIFAHLMEQGRALGTEALAEALHLHPNGVRRHLQRLAGAGLVERRKARGARGRPADIWAVAAGARPGGHRPSGYGELAGWLARAIPPAPGRLREVEAVGREIGRELAPARSDEPIESFREALSALGFEPAVGEEDSGGFSYRLDNCPYRDSVRANAEVVCTLHRGLTAGLLAELDPAAKLVRFEPRDPERAGCALEVTMASGLRPAAGLGSRRR
jgi:predicted ArsR family transcriptional regulator